MQYIQPLLNAFEAAANPTLAEPMKKYMKGRFEFYGIKAPQRREIFKNFLKEYGLPPVAELEDVVEALWEQPYRECHYAAVEIFQKFQKQFPPHQIALMEELIATNSWWDTVDVIAAHLVGPFFRKYPDLIASNTERWINCDNLWLQRTAIIYQLSYKGQTDSEQLFRFARQRASSKEFFIRKSIGWALRQYSYHNPEAVRQFVEETPLHPLSKREALKGIARKGI